MTDKYGNRLDAPTFKTYLHTPEWIFRLMWPADKTTLESLSNNFLFDWFSQLSNNPRDFYAMYFMLDERDQAAFSCWAQYFLLEKRCGSLWRRIRSIRERMKKGFPVWEH